MLVSQIFGHGVLISYHLKFFKFYIHYYNLFLDFLKISVLIFIFRFFIGYYIYFNFLYDISIIFIFQFYLS